MSAAHGSPRNRTPGTVTASDRRVLLRRPFVRVLLACAGLHIAWAFAMPVTSAPDEPAHIYRAVSLWEGQLLPSVQDPRDSWLVRVPTATAAYAESTSCTRWRADVPAGCTGPVAGRTGVTTVGTAAGRYFPLYYAAVGWPGHLRVGVTGFYAMRVLSALVSSVLLALAVVTVLRTVGARWAGIALPVAITPQVLWLGSTINPNAWEVDAGILTWAAALALVSGLSMERRQTLWGRFLLGACVLLLMRRLSPLWLVLIVAGVMAVRLCIAAATRPSMRPLATHRTAVIGAVLGGLAALSAWWHLRFDLATVTGYRNTDPAPGGFWPTLGALVADIPRWLQQTYGVFGWLDTPSPGVAELGWVVVASALFALVTLGAVHRRRVVVTAAVGLMLCVAVPLAFGLTVGREVGIHFWQGRYTMPFAQGIPLGIAIIGASRRDGPAELTRLLRLASPAAAWLLWPGLGTLSFVWAIHRYGSGADAGWDLDAWSWSPPGGVPLLVVTYLAAGVALVAALRDAPHAVSADDRPEAAAPAVTPTALAAPRTR